MAVEYSCLKEKIRFKYIYYYLKTKIEFAKNNPDYFNPDGLVVFCGAQGTGKTLSAVNYVYRLLQEYPSSKVVTNLSLSDYPVVTFKEYVETKGYIFDEISPSETIILHDDYLITNKVFPFMDAEDFEKYDNGWDGVIFLVDEIQLYLSSLQSKNINLEVLVQIAQQRKQRKHIVSTSQVFGRLAKPLREQFSNVIACKNYLGFLQVNKLIDRDSLDDDNSTSTNIKGTVKKVFFWFHNPQFYKRYDTYTVIKKGNFVHGDEKRGDLYGINGNC